MPIIKTKRGLERQAIKAIHHPPKATDTVKVSKEMQDEKRKMVRELVPFLMYLYKKHMGAKISENMAVLQLEDISIPISVGDTILGGKFKNKRIVVKSIGKNEKGDITINGKPLLKYRLLDEGYNKGEIHKGKLKIDGKPVEVEVELIGADNKTRTYIAKVIHIDKKYLSRLPKDGILNIPAKIFHRGGWVKVDTSGQFEMQEDLRKWFGKGKTGSTDGGGWDRYGSDGQKLGKCGDGKEGDAYAACLSKEKAAKLGPKGRASFVKRKRADQKKSGDTKKGGNRTKGKTPTFSKTGASEGKIHEIPMGDLQKIDQFADKKLNPVDVVLTDKHFFDRLNDPRNGKEISQAELIGFFKRLSKHKKEFVEFLNKYNSVVAVDDRTNINIPFMKQANKAIAKTVMRKKDFKTPDQKLDI